MPKRYACPCGASFATRKKLIEHVRVIANMARNGHKVQGDHNDNAANHPSITKQQEKGA